MKAFGARAHGLRLERMRASPRWAGEGFRNLHPVPPGLRDLGAARPSLGDFVCGGARRAPSAPLPADDPRTHWSRAVASGLRATWLGHSTVLLEMDGVRLLTDPVWGARASPFRLLGPRRFQPVPLKLRELPPLDAVLISHDHYDHLCHATVRTLARSSAVPFVTSLGVGAHLQAWGVPPERIHELDWWESHRVGAVTVTAAPSQHFSGRGLKDRNATLWSSFALRSDRHAVFFSGDTGLTTEYAHIADRLGPFDLVMLEVGAYHPSWGDIHLGPLNAVQAHALLGGGALLPVHWGTFSLALHDWDEPVETLLAQAGRLRAPLLLPHLGEAVEPAHAAAPRPWWRSAGTAPADADAVPADSARLRQLPWPLD
ncbi:MAG: MBL fold metallo-hydrolase [Rubrivivax sp.]